MKCRDTKGLYDRRVNSIQLRPGDRVLAKVAPTRLNSKLKNRWEEQPYEVLEQIGADAPVYRIKREDSGKVRVLHRNRLFLLLQTKEEDPGAAESAVSKCAQSVAGQTEQGDSVDQLQAPDESGEPDSDSEGEDAPPSSGMLAAAVSFLASARASLWRTTDPKNGGPKLSGNFFFRS